MKRRERKNERKVGEGKKVGGECLCGEKAKRGRRDYKKK